MNLQLSFALLVFASLGFARESQAQPPVVTQFLQQHKAALRNPPAGFTALNSPAEEEAQMKAYFDAYLRAHPKADPATCKISTVSTSETSYEGDPAGYPAWLSKFKSKAKGAATAGTVTFALYEAKKGSGVMPKNDKDDLGPVNSYEKLQAAIRKAFKRGKDLGRPVEKVRIATQMLEDHMEVTLAEFEDWLKSEFGFPKSGVERVNAIYLNEAKKQFFSVGGDRDDIVTMKATVRYQTVKISCADKAPVPTPTPTPKPPRPTPTPTPKPPRPTPTPTPKPPRPTPTPTPKPPRPTPTPTPKPPRPTPTPTPKPPKATPTPTPKPVKPKATPTPTPKPPKATPTPTPKPPKATPTPTPKPPKATPTPTPVKPKATPTPTPTPVKPKSTPTPTPTPVKPKMTPTPTPTPTPVPEEPARWDLRKKIYLTWAGKRDPRTNSGAIEVKAPLATAKADLAPLSTHPFFDKTFQLFEDIQADETIQTLWKTIEAETNCKMEFTALFTKVHRELEFELEHASGSGYQTSISYMSGFVVHGFNPSTYYPVHQEYQMDQRRWGNLSPTSTFASSVEVHRAKLQYILDDVRYRKIKCGQ